MVVAERGDKSEVELARWTCRVSRRGRVAYVDKHEGNMYIVCADVAGETFKGEMIVPNTNHWNQRIGEGQTKPHKEGKKQERTKLTLEICVLRDLWTRCLGASAGLPVRGRTNCSLCGEAVNVNRCFVCKRTFHSECDIDLVGSPEDEATDMIAGMAQLDWSILPECITGSAT